MSKILLKYLRGEEMKLSVRLALETIQNIEKLKEILTEESFGELRITNGYAVNQAFRETMGKTDWKNIIQNTTPLKQKKFGKLEETPLKTNLTVNDETKKYIDELKKDFPKYTESNYVTVSDIIRIVVRAALLNRDESK